MAVAAANDQTNESRYLETLADVREAFLIYRDERSVLTLRFTQHPGEHTAKLLDVTDTDLLLENIEPRSGMKLLRDGAEFSLSCRSHGQWVMADKNTVHLATDERGVPYFHVKLPSRMLYQQRRREARFSLPLRVQASGALIRLVGNNVNSELEPMVGQVLELSSGGCRARFDGVPTAPFAVGELIPKCLLEIEAHLTVSADVCVRHVQVAEESTESMYGLEFTHMSVTDRRRLEQYVGLLAKQQK